MFQIGTAVNVMQSTGPGVTHGGRAPGLPVPIAASSKAPERGRSARAAFLAQLALQYDGKAQRNRSRAECRQAASELYGAKHGAKRNDARARRGRTRAWA